MRMIKRGHSVKFYVPAASKAEQEAVDAHRTQRRAELAQQTARARCSRLDTCLYRQEVEQQKAPAVEQQSDQ